MASIQFFPAEVSSCFIELTTFFAIINKGFKLNNLFTCSWRNQAL